MHVCSLICIFVYGINRFCHNVALVFLYYKLCLLAKIITYIHTNHVMRKPVVPYANNKGADQPAHLCSLISAFVVHYQDSIIPLVFISEISSLYLASVAAQAGLSLTWSRIPKTGFLMTRLILYFELLI